jgi:hypothetical protein
LGQSALMAAGGGVRLARIAPVDQAAIQAMFSA